MKCFDYVALNLKVNFIAMLLHNQTTLETSTLNEPTENKNRRSLKLYLHRVTKSFRYMHTDIFRAFYQSVSEKLSYLLYKMPFQIHDYELNYSLSVKYISWYF